MTTTTILFAPSARRSAAAGRPSPARPSIFAPPVAGSPTASPPVRTIPPFDPDPDPDPDSEPDSAVAPALAAVPTIRPVPRAPVAPAEAPPRSAALGIAARRAFGGLLPLIDAPETRDLLVQVRDGEGRLWIDRGHGAEAVPDWRTPPEAIDRLARELIAAGGRHIDELCPFADVRLGDGIRVHAVLPPVAGAGAAVSIRLPAAVRPGFEDLVSGGLCDPATARLLRSSIARRSNLLITGATGSGKTTLLAALLDLVDPGERIITIEDVAELRLRHPHVVSLEARQANGEGVGALGVDRLLRETLRMRPDRLVLGECRGAETATLLEAMNTGHDGGAGTLHASGLAEVPARLEMLGRLAGLDAESVARQAASAIQLVVHVARGPAGHRITAIGALTREGGGLGVAPFDRGRALRRAG